LKAKFFIFVYPKPFLMRTFTIFLACLVGVMTLNAQTPDLVISEIMYNPPESGIDTYEYLEIYNNGANAVDLSGYSLSGVDYVFTSGFNLGTGEYLLLAGDSIAFEAAFGLTALQWTNGSLSNGGELLKLFDAT